MLAAVVVSHLSACLHTPIHTCCSGSEYVGSKREVINLEMVADPDAEPSSPLAQALRNTTDTEIK